MRSLDYTVIRTNRKTTVIQVREEGVLVRTSRWVSDKEIDEYVRQNRAWIEKTLEKLENEKKNQPKEAPLSMDEIRVLADRALQVIPERVKYYAPLIGVTYGRITIRNQKTRWGSCSAKGNLNFNCLLMLAPPEVIDSVVVHELCHRKEMNHSPAFYEEVRRVFPDYDKWNRWLKENGSALMKRMTG